MGGESLSPDELKPDVVKLEIRKPFDDLKPKNTQPEVVGFYTSSHFATNKKYEYRGELINWVHCEA
jgi:hypothetical protein